MMERKAMRAFPMRCHVAALLFAVVTAHSAVAAENTLSHPSDAEFLAQSQRPEMNSLGTMVMMLYVMVNCRAIKENDAILITNSELQKLKGKGIDPAVQLNIVASAKLQAATKATPNACAFLQNHPDGVTKIKQAANAITQTQAPGDPYANAYQNQKMKVYQENRDKFMNGVRILSFARHCNVIPNYTWFIGQNILQLLALQTIGKDYPPDITTKNETQWRFKFRADVGALWQEGKEKVKQEGCDFWKENPETLYSIRETATQVSGGVGGLPYWFPSLQDAQNRGVPRGPTLVD
jgi:hypothetical protein